MARACWRDNYQERALLSCMLPIDYRITQSQSSIYEFLFPEIPLCLYTSYIVYESTISEYIYPGAVYRGFSLLDI